MLGTRWVSCRLLVCFSRRVRSRAHPTLALSFSCIFAVPFYGQGLNCGLEDVRVLASILAAHSVTGTTGSTTDLEAALKEFSEVRKNDLKAILQLALSN